MTDTSLRPSDSGATPDGPTGSTGHTGSAGRAGRSGHDSPTGPAGPAGPSGTALVAAPDARRLVGLALVTGLALEVGLRGGVTNAVVVSGLVLVVVALLTGGRVRRGEAHLLAVAAVLPIGFLAVRASPWLAWSNLGVAAALIGAAVLYSRSGSVLDATPGRMIQRGEAGLGRGLAGLTVVGAAAPRLTPHERHRLAGLARALVVAVPVLGALVLLLASADAVFASLLTPDVGLGRLSGHALLTLVLAPVVLVLAAAASAPLTDRPRRGGYGVVEVATMLGLAAAVLGLFVVSQLVALTDAGRRLVESAGLTPAEYARSGFFQLCWATGLLLAFLALVRALAAPEALAHPLVRGLGAAVPTLALGLVVVSLRRMALYDHAFGLTMLRLWVVGAAVWMGLVLVMTAARNLAPPTGPSWLVAGAGVAAVALVLAADVADAEAFVARHNIERAREGAELDLHYLAGLSDDAVPAIAAAGPLDGVAVTPAPQDRGDGRDGPVGQAGQLASPSPDDALRCGDDERGAAALNLAAARAADVRRDRCPARAPAGTP